MTVALVALYLVAIVAANLSVAHFGPPSAPINALLFIGLDLTTRDALHDRWRGRALPVRMALLIAVGSLASWLINPAAGRIAIASALAFAAAATVDAGIYQLARSRPWLVRSNTSNLASAAVDSLVFPAVAFGGFDWRLTAALFAAKVAGGFVWSLLLARTRHREPAHAAARD